MARGKPLAFSLVLSPKGVAQNMNRRLAREKALQTLFQIDVSGIETEEALENVLKQKEKDQFLVQLIEGTTQHLSEIDNVIETNLENWSLPRLAKVDLNVLRIGVYELLFNPDIPDNVAINEAIEVAKKYGDENSGKFVNGLLSKVKNNKN